VWGASSVESTPDLFREQVWCQLDGGRISLSSQHQTCSGNKFGVSRWRTYLSIESTPDLFREQVWCQFDGGRISPSSQHQNCSRNKFRYVHRVDTKLVPGTHLGASPSSRYQICSGNKSGSLCTESTPKLFREQIWCVSPSSRFHQVDTKVILRKILGSFHRVSTKVVPGTHLGSLSIESTLDLFLEQI
jgi:hypothetical protein